MEMTLREDCYSNEASLINRSKRELADGIEKDPIHKLRLLCFAKGSTGILDVARALRCKTPGDDQAISYAEFKESISQTGLDYNETELKRMFQHLDTDHKGSIDINELVAKLRPPLTRSRLNVIDRAFEQIDNTGSGFVTIKQLGRAFNVKDHPKYLSGDLSEQEILNQFLSNFGGKHGTPNKKISKEEFVNYYSTVSASIENDAYFDLLLRRTYKL